MTPTLSQAFVNEQAHQLAEEEEDDNEDEDGNESRDDLARQQQPISSQRPARRDAKTPNSSDTPLKTRASKAREETGKADYNKTKSPPNGRAASTGPTASRIHALKAKLEADKARKAARSASSVFQ